MTTDCIFKVNFILLRGEGSVLQKHVLICSYSPDICVWLTEKLLNEKFKAFIPLIQAHVRKRVSLIQEHHLWTCMISGIIKPLRPVCRLHRDRKNIFWGSLVHQNYDCFSTGYLQVQPCLGYRKSSEGPEQHKVVSALSTECFLLIKKFLHSSVQG